MNRRFKLGAVSAVASIAILGLTFWFGVLWRDGSSGSPRSAKRGEFSEEEYESVERKNVIRKFSGSSLISGPDGSFAPSVQAALRNALQVPDSIRRKYAVELILSGLALSDIGQAVSFLEGLNPSARRDEIQNSLLRRWAELDGRSALAYALDSSLPWLREAAVSAALGGWAGNDPEGAWQWAIDNPGEGRFQSARLNAVIARLAEEEITVAFSFAQSVANEGLRTGVLRTIADRILNEDSFGPDLQVFAELPEGASKDLVMDYIARRWGRYEPEIAAGWILENFGHRPGGRALSSIAATWATSDPVRAAGWAARLPDGKARMVAVTAAISSWLRSGDATAAAEWLNQQPTHRDYDRAVKQVAMTTMHEDPEAAMTWAESIVDPELRETTVTLVAGSWIREEPESASAYFEASGLALPNGTVMLRDTAVGILRAGEGIDSVGDRSSVVGERSGRFIPLDESAAIEVAGPEAY